MFLRTGGSGLSILCSYLTSGTDGKRNLRQSKIQNLRVSALGQENVCRFDVSVDNTSDVSGIESI